MFSPSGPTGEFNTDPLPLYGTVFENERILIEKNCNQRAFLEINHMKKKYIEVQMSRFKRKFPEI